MLAYAYFRHCGYPIGSGCIESGQKIVVQRRRKGAGIRWTEQNLYSMLSLCNLVCNEDWEAGGGRLSSINKYNRLLNEFRPPMINYPEIRLHRLNLLLSPSLLSSVCSLRLRVPTQQPRKTYHCQPVRPLTIHGIIINGRLKSRGVGTDIISRFNVHPFCQISSFCQIPVTFLSGKEEKAPILYS